MVKKMKKVLSTALSIFLMLSVVIQTSIVYAEEGKTGSEYYLSDLKWVSASHGDYDTTKEVQKDVTPAPVILYTISDGDAATVPKPFSNVRVAPSSIVRLIFVSSPLFPGVNG